MASNGSNPEKHVGIRSVYAPKSPNCAIGNSQSSYLSLLTCFSDEFSSSLPLGNLSGVGSCSRGSTSVFVQRNGGSRFTRTARAFCSPTCVCNFTYIAVHNIIPPLPFHLQNLINNQVSCKIRLAGRRIWHQHHITGKGGWGGGGTCSIWFCPFQIVARQNLLFWWNSG